MLKIAVLHLKFKSKPTQEEKNEELLNKLPKRGPKAFDLFCEALIKNGQEYLVTKYLKPAGNHSTGQSKLIHYNCKLNCESLDH